MHRVLQEAPHRRGRARTLAAAVEIMMTIGDIAAAREAATELDALAQRLKTPFMYALAAEAQGAVFLGEGNPTPALFASRKAWTLWRDLDVPYEAARTQVTIANACRALGDNDSADFELSAARRTFEQLGARLDAAGVASAGRRPRDTAGLTSRELQVLRLVATGRSNRVIATDLGLSEKTVARHVSNIFNKLDVSSRAAATAYAFEHRLTDRST
jgi:ATP/maltotriose-dependent transcriptional regulator MalT